MRGIDAGPLANAVAVEALTPVLLYINKAYSVKGCGYSHHRHVIILEHQLTSTIITALPGIPMIQPGDDLRADHSGCTGARWRMTLANGDALVVTSKIVSKAEGRFVRSERRLSRGEEAHRAGTGNAQRPAHRRTGAARKPARFRAKRRACWSRSIGWALSAPMPELTSRMWTAARSVCCCCRLTRMLRLRAIRDALQDGRPARRSASSSAIRTADRSAWATSAWRLAWPGCPRCWIYAGRPDLFGRELKISIQGYADMSRRRRIC